MENKEKIKMSTKSKSIGIVKNATASSLTIGWITMLAILFVGFIGETYIPALKLGNITLAIILTASGTIGLLETFFDGRRLTWAGVVKRKPLDFLTAFGAVISLLLATGYWLNFEPLIMMLQSFVGGTLLTNFVVLLIGGISNRI